MKIIEYFSVAPDVLTAVAARAQGQYPDTIPEAVTLDVIDILTGTNWSEGDDHQVWLDTAPIEEITEWTLTVYADLIDGRRAEREFESPELPLDTAEYYTIIDHQMMA